MSIFRIIVAGIAGGIVMFVWGAVSHMALPIGEMGLKNLPNDAVLLPQMKSAVTEKGFYRFPPMDPNCSEAEMKIWEERVAAGPYGMLLIHPTGTQFYMAALMSNELLSNVLAALIVAIMLARIHGTWIRMAGFAAGVGVVGWLSILFSYWNWYGFPREFVAGQLLEQAIGWFLTGAGIGLVLTKVRGSAPAKSQPGIA